MWRFSFVQSQVELEQLDSFLWSWKTLHILSKRPPHFLHEHRKPFLNLTSRFDLYMHCDVTERDVTSLRETSGLPVMRSGGEVTDGLGDVAALLNCLAENLWHQDCLTARSDSHRSQQEAGTLPWFHAVLTSISWSGGAFNVECDALTNCWNG